MTITDSTCCAPAMQTIGYTDTEKITIWSAPVSVNTTLTDIDITLVAAKREELLKKATDSEFEFTLFDHDERINFKKFRFGLFRELRHDAVRIA